MPHGPLNKNYLDLHLNDLPTVLLVLRLLIGLPQPENIAVLTLTKRNIKIILRRIRENT